MSYNALESSRTLGKPLKLYLFRYGEGENDYYAYTDGIEPVDYAGMTFVPLPIDSDSVKSNGTMDKTVMKASTTRNADVGDVFQGWPPTAVVWLTIYEGHVDDTEFKVSWAGRVTSIERAGNEVSYGAEPVSTSMKRVGLRRNWQYGCPHVLYSDGEFECQANKAAATVTAVVAAVATPIVTLPADWNGARPKAKYLNGTASWTGPDGRTHTRNIMANVSDTEIRLSGTTTGLVVGATLTLVLGCNHDMDDCQDLHDNILNFGGQKWIPFDNPMGIKNNFY